MVRAPAIVDRQKQLETFAAVVRTHYGKRFDAAAGRFKSAQRLLKRFDQAREALHLRGCTAFRQVYESHNELCIADRILSNEDPVFSVLDYEPKLKRCRQSIDFRATSDLGLVVFVDVKTIKPDAKDRWGQFERARTEGWFPQQVNVVHAKDWLGGQLWHYDCASRERFLEYALELEGKIRGHGGTSKNTFFVLALCGTGFEWDEGDLEDFVSYYYEGVHRPDDSFARMELKYLQDKEVLLDRSISRFAYMQRGELEIVSSSFNGKVQPGPFHG